MADTVNVVDRCCANVERAERELVQPRPRPGGLVIYAGAFFTACFSRRSVPCFSPGICPFFRHSGCSTPNTTILPTRVYPLSILTLLALGPTFSVAVVCMVAAENDFALLGCIATSRYCFQTWTVSIDESSHQPMPYRDIDSCKNSIAGTSSN